MSGYPDVLLRLAIAQITKNIGWSAIGTTSFDVIQEISKRFIVELGKVSSDFAQNCGRNEIIPSDLEQALLRLNVSLNSVQEYIDEVNEVPFLGGSNVILKASKNFSKRINYADSKELASRPEFYEEWMPSFGHENDPNKTENECILEEMDLVSLSPDDETSLGEIYEHFEHQEDKKLNPRLRTRLQKLNIDGFTELTAMETKYIYLSQDGQVLSYGGKQGRLPEVGKPQMEENEKIAFELYLNRQNKIEEKQCKENAHEACNDLYAFKGKSKRADLSKLGNSLKKHSLPLRCEQKLITSKMSKFSVNSKLSQKLAANKNLAAKLNAHRILDKNLDKDSSVRSVGRPRLNTKNVIQKKLGQSRLFTDLRSIDKFTKKRLQKSDLRKGTGNPVGRPKKNNKIKEEAAEFDAKKSKYILNEPQVSKKTLEMETRAKSRLNEKLKQKDANNNDIDETKIISTTDVTEAKDSEPSSKIIPKLRFKISNGLVVHSDISSSFPVNIPPSTEVPLHYTECDQKIKKNKKDAGCVLITETVGSYSQKIWYCPDCKSPDDGTPMIGCDKCDEWFHWRCVDIHAAPGANEQWFCKRCRKQRKKNKIDFGVAMESPSKTDIKKDRKKLKDKEKCKKTAKGKKSKKSEEKLWICPSCKSNDDGSPMIGCDRCDKWFHWSCMGILVSPRDEDSWFCPRCSK